jgi:hypothetical protein
MITKEVVKAGLITASIASVGLLIYTLAFVKGKLPRDLAILLAGLTAGLAAGIASWSTDGRTGNAIGVGLFMAISCAATQAVCISSYTEAKQRRIDSQK